MTYAVHEDGYVQSQLAWLYLALQYRPLQVPTCSKELVLRIARGVLSRLSFLRFCFLCTCKEESKRTQHETDHSSTRDEHNFTEHRSDECDPRQNDKAP